MGEGKTALNLLFI